MDLWPGSEVNDFASEPQFSCTWRPMLWLRMGGLEPGVAEAGGDVDGGAVGGGGRPEQPFVLDR